MRQDVAPHAWVPELPQVAGNRRDRLVLLLVGEEPADLVRHICKPLRRHMQASQATCRTVLATVARAPRAPILFPIMSAPPGATVEVISRAFPGRSPGRSPRRSLGRSPRRSLGRSLRRRPHAPERSRRDDARGVGENFERVAAGDADQGDAGGLRQAHRQRGRRRHRDHHRRADHRRLLHQLDGDAARQQQQPIAGADPRARQRTGELVERVVPADILAQRDHAARRMPEGGGMHRVGLLVQPLAGGHRRHGRDDVGRREARIGGDARRLADRVRQALQAAQAAAARAGEAALAHGQRIDAVRRQPHAELDALVGRDDLDFLDLAGALDDAFGQAEADGEVFQVGRASPASPHAWCGYRSTRPAFPPGWQRDAVGALASPRAQCVRRVRTVPGPRSFRRHHAAMRLLAVGQLAITIPAIRSVRSTARSAPPSPCIPGSWLPSRRTRRSPRWPASPDGGTWCRPRPAPPVR